MSPTSRKTRSACSWLTARGSRPVRPAAGIAGVRAAAGHDGADREGRARRVTSSPAREPTQQRRHGHEQRGRRIALARALVQHDGQSPTSTIDSRKCAITDQGFSPVLHRDAARQRLAPGCRGRPAVASSAHAGPHQGASRQTAIRHPSTTDRQREGEQPVAELDQPVRSAYSGVGVSVVVVHRGQVGATQARPGEAHRTTGHDDGAVGHDARQRHAGARWTAAAGPSENGGSLVTCVSDTGAGP